VSWRPISRAKGRRNNIAEEGRGISTDYPTSSTANSNANVFAKIYIGFLNDSLLPSSVKGTVSRNLLGSS